MYHIKGHKYQFLTGSRAQVAHGTAYKTDGTPGLKRADLKQNKHGRYVSKKLSLRAAREKRLVKAGYKTRKGKFGSFLDGKTTLKHGKRGRGSRKSHRRRRH